MGTIGKLCTIIPMERFQSLVMKLAQNSTGTPLDPSQKTLLQDRLNQLFADYKTPDHPPYSAMIERALKELSEKETPTLEKISEFIRKKYVDLPQAHSTFLRHHLQKLCESGEIVMTSGIKYMLAGENASLPLNAKCKKRKRKVRWAFERNKNRKKKGQQEGNCIADPGQLDENGVDGKEEQRTDTKTTTELRILDCFCSPQNDMDQSELKRDVICGLGEKQEGEHAKDDQSTLFSPERPPSFESLIIRDLVPEQIHLNKGSSLMEERIVGGEKEFIDSMPQCFSNALVNSQVSDCDTQIKQSEHQPTTLDKASSMNEQSLPETLETENEEKVETNFFKQKTLETRTNLLTDEVQSGSVLAQGSEFSQSHRLQRQLRRWSLPAPKPASSRKLAAPSKSKNQQKECFTSPDLEKKAPEEEQRQLRKAEVLDEESPHMIESKHKELIKYFRRTNQILSNHEKSYAMDSGSEFKPSTIVDSRSSSIALQVPQLAHSCEKEPQGYKLAEKLQGKPCRNKHYTAVIVQERIHLQQKSRETLVRRSQRLLKQIPGDHNNFEQ